MVPSANQGNEFPCPESFLKGFPADFSLDGELFTGRHKFQETLQTVKDPQSLNWFKVTYQVFDAPTINEPFEERQEALAEYFSANVAPTVELAKHIQVANKEALEEELKKLESLGSEGVMLRKPKSMYVGGKRSATLLKVKSFYDAEARVEEIMPGKGKYTGMLGALQCVMASGLTFKIGTGYSDAARLKPPKVGSIISYRFQDLSVEGIPRFPAYVGERTELTEPRDAIIPAHRLKSEEDDG
jgi:DNA ligase 1